MKSIADLKKEIIEYWNEDELFRNNVDKNILNYASSTPEEIVIKEIRDNYIQDIDSGMDVIYFALSSKPDKWIRFFAEEYERAFLASETSNNPYEYLEVLESIGWKENKKHEFINKIIETLAKYLNHSNDAIRFKAIWLLGDWLVEGNENKYPNIIRELRNKLQDDNWRIRWVAQETLKDIKQLPKDYKMGLLDRFRVKFLDQYKF